MRPIYATRCRALLFFNPRIRVQQPFISPKLSNFLVFCDSCCNLCIFDLYCRSLFIGARRLILAIDGSSDDSYHQLEVSLSAPGQPNADIRFPVFSSNCFDLNIFFAVYFWLSGCQDPKIYFRCRIDHFNVVPGRFWTRETSPKHQLPFRKFWP